MALSRLFLALSWALSASLALSGSLWHSLTLFGTFWLSLVTSDVQLLVVWLLTLVNSDVGVVGDDHLHLLGHLPQLGHLWAGCSQQLSEGQCGTLWWDFSLSLT